MSFISRHVEPGSNVDVAVDVMLSFACGYGVSWLGHRILRIDPLTGGIGCALASLVGYISDHVCTKIFGKGEGLIPRTGYYLSLAIKVLAAAELVTEAFMMPVLPCHLLVLYVAKEAILSYVAFAASRTGSKHFVPERR